LGVAFDLLWDLPGIQLSEEDYRLLTPPELKPQVGTAGRTNEVILEFGLNRPGKHRLRAAAVDMAGRSTVCWTPTIATERGALWLAHTWLDRPDFDRN
jgi:hypothetical protein